MTRPDDILDFWFSEAHRALWWQRDDGFDAKIRARFARTAEDAAAGRYDDWIESPEGALALVIALDQFSRNLYRGSPRAWAQDAKARGVMREALRRGYDDSLRDKDMRQFLYMPLMHSEDARDQADCVRLFAEHFPDDEQANRAARDHKAAIDRYGRFPHRNKILGRPSTPEEEEYLSDPNAGW